MRLLAIGFVISCTVPGYAQTHALSMADGGELRLEKKGGDELAGTFRRGNAVAVFDSIASSEALVFDLHDGKGRPVVHVTATKDEVSASVFDERIVVRSPRGGEPKFELQNGDGQEQLLRELIKNEAYAVLPNLAIELVHLGIVGNSDRFPAAQFLHGIAVASANAQGLTMPVLPEPDDRAAGQIIALVGKCENLKGNPNCDTCYGMCGNSCTCWWPVCLTCCGCEGCHTHDWACRVTGCKDLHLTAGQQVAYRTGCLTFAAFFVARNPCERYAKGKHSPPCKGEPGPNCK